VVGLVTGTRDGKGGPQPLKSQPPGDELNPGEALELTPEKLTSNIIKLALPAVGENLHQGIAPGPERLQRG